MKTSILFIDLHCDATMPAGAKEFGGGNSYSRGVLNFILKHSDLNCLYITRKKFKELPSSEILGKNCNLVRIVLGDVSPNDKDTLQKYTDNAVEQILKLINDYQFKDFTIHSSYWQSGLVALKILEIFSARLIHTIQSNGLKKKKVGSEQADLDFRITSEKLVFDTADYLVCSSVSEKNEIEKLYHIPQSKLIFTGLPIDDSFLYPTKTFDGKIKTHKIGTSASNFYLPLQKNAESCNGWRLNGPFIFYGRLHIDKGVCEIVEAWKNLFNIYGNRTPPLWIVGGTNEQIEKIHNYLSDKNIFIDENEKNSQIIWWGTLSPADLSCLLTKSIAVVSHSKYESAGLMVLESLAVNVPVIATPYGYAKNYIKNWYNGFLVEFGNIPLLEYRMSHFIEQPYLSDLMKKNAKKTFGELQQAFDFEAMHYRLYTAEKIASVSHKVCLSFGEEKILPYCTILSTTTVLSYINQCLPLQNINIIKQCVSDKSLITIVSANGTRYRADIWLTTINEIIPCLYDDYIETASQMVDSVCSLSSLCCFKNLAGYSISNNLTVIKYSEEQNFKEAVDAYNELFYSESDICLTKLNPKSAVQKLKAFVNKKLRYNKVVILNLLSRLETLCNDNFKYGTVPIFTSKNIIYDNCFYGITNCVLSSYGMGIALLLRSYKIDANIISDFDNCKVNDILNWMIFFKIYDLSLMIYKNPQTDIFSYVNEVQNLFSLK